MGGGWAVVGREEGGGGRAWAGRGWLAGLRVPAHAQGLRARRPREPEKGPARREEECWALRAHTLGGAPGRRLRRVLRARRGVRERTLEGRRHEGEAARGRGAAGRLLSGDAFRRAVRLGGRKFPLGYGRGAVRLWWRRWCGEEGAHCPWVVP